MVKQVIALLVLSVVIVVASVYAQQVVHGLLAAHDWVSNLLTDVFSGGQAGNIARGMLSLLCVPLLVGIVPALAYWALRRHMFPYFMETVWIVWLLQAGAMLVMQS